MISIKIIKRIFVRMKLFDNFAALKIRRSYYIIDPWCNGNTPGFGPGV